mmetsp:Transcript_9280/g.9643  ORF Transcript_9280/g.9643 Transcript_9280/m.9643 type:complete len:99 (-) Transcript_9280:81-377(-)
MSKKNNKQKSKNIYNFMAEKEKEIIRRLEEKRKKKQVNKQARDLTNTLSSFTIEENKNKEPESNIDLDDDINMVNKVSRPKKATRVRRRHREIMLQRK